MWHRVIATTQQPSLHSATLRGSFMNLNDALTSSQTKDFKTNMEQNGLGEQDPDSSQFPDIQEKWKTSSEALQLDESTNLKGKQAA